MKQLANIPKPVPGRVGSIKTKCNMGGFLTVSQPISMEIVLHMNLTFCEGLNRYRRIYGRYVKLLIHGTF